MAFDPVQVAEAIKNAYASNLIGIHPQAMNRILQRLGDPGSSEQRLNDFVRMRGPFLQALSIPRWGNTNWNAFVRALVAPLAPHGFAEEVIRTFEDLQFKRLYQFQEEAIQAVLNDSHTLVVAGTGRGKTESWLLPILQYIIARKRNEIHDTISVNGTKALLIYPTKALAQDQLKRLLNYLFRLNAKLEPSARISVGIFDGDTPYRAEATKQAYLREAFKYFQCPIYDRDAPKCQPCGRHLSVIYDPVFPEHLNLAVPRAECRHLADLGFVRLVREDIVESCPDIVLTNPDMLNLRLLNVNGEDERLFLIEQPKFIVLDEVHTYTELFGSFTAFIMRRLRQQRAEIRRRRGDASPDPLLFIAASATVANDRDLFVRLCDLADDNVAVVREQPTAIPAVSVSDIPDVLHSELFTDEHLNDALCTVAAQQTVKTPYAQLLRLFDLKPADLPPIESGEEAVLEAATEQMFARLTSDVSETPGLNILRLLHRALTERPMSPTELRAFLAERYSILSPKAITRLVSNFALLGARAGLLENRVHLFAWPIDGFYVCIRCGHVFDAPQGSCRICSGNFITKLALCNECGEEALESWFCPHCRTLYPLNVTVDGEMVYWRGLTCNCTGSDKPAIRVIWKPWYRCAQCGDVRRVATSEFSGTGPSQCDRCGGAREPIIELPWVCQECGRTFLTGAAPASCSCGKQTFALGGLFDIPQAKHCTECHGDFLPDWPHDASHHSALTGVLDEFKLLDGKWRVRKPTDFRVVVPCYHPRVRYDKQGRYEPLMRSPANTAVTSAQFALRAVASTDGVTPLRDRLGSAKMLSFSDSYSDMEQLAQDFDDPERNTFIDQAVVAALLQGERTLKALQNDILERLKMYGEKLGTENEQAWQTYNWIRHFEETDLRDEVTRRFVAGHYLGAGSQAPWLVREAIANIRLDVGRLSADESRILRAVVARNNQSRFNLSRSLDDQITAFDATLENLSERSIVQVRTSGRSEIVSLNSDRLICFLVDQSHPITRTSRRDRFVSDLEHDLSPDVDPHEEHFGLHYDQRLDPNNASFSYVAYRLAFSEPLLLRAEVYKGDIDKKTRRKIEYAFKYGADMHFLSSGPAMEVGIDIGDLNLLLLYGTPPNVNNYLQRIGRAGRRAKRSLVLSVSKRNPIDYYYYRHPLDLITSHPQPVPLNEFNEEALRASLTWALLDFIAGRYWVPWQRQKTPDGTHYTDGQDFRSVMEPNPADLVRLLTMVFSVPTQEIGYGLPLRTLSTIIHDRRDDARAYLVRLLSQQVCNVCGRYVQNGAVRCPDNRCDGVVALLAERYGVLIEEALDQFPSRMVEFLNDFRKDLRQKRRAFTRERESIEDDVDENPRLATDRLRTKMAELARVEGRLRAIDDLITRLDDATMVEAQQYSAQARFAYQIRTAGDAVEVVRYSDQQGVIRAEPRPSRDMGMAIKEYHPYAVILSGREKVFTRAVAFDGYKTEELKARLSSTSLAVQPLACPACGSLYDGNHGTHCTCGTGLTRMELHVLQRADTQSVKLALTDDPDEPGKRLYPNEVFRSGAGDKRVARTYATVDNQVIEFAAARQAEIVDAMDHPVGLLEFGRLELVTFTDGCTVTYEDGSREPWTQRYTICGEEDCNGVVVQSHDVRFCALDPRHDMNKSRIVRLGYQLNTQSLRLSLYQEPWAVTHSLTHGLRVALEKIGGLSVRNLNELLSEPSGQTYIYDTIPGGAGVTELLLRMEGGRHRHFETALEVIGRLMQECECADGCPHCLYQYGCHNWNKPTTLSRLALANFLMTSPRLVPRSATP